MEACISLGKGGKRATQHRLIKTLIIMHSSHIFNTAPLGPPTIISDSDSFTYAEDGRPLTIHCTADPGALVAWYIENIPIDPQDNDEEEPRIIGGDLIFTRVRMRHSGWYTCAVANQFGRAEEDFLVIVGGGEMIEFHACLYTPKFCIE